MNVIRQRYNVTDKLHFISIILFLAELSYKIGN
jgi:hypothetical protein